MAFFKVNTSEENIKDYSSEGNTKWLNRSGIYDIVVKAVIVDSTAKGSEYINLWLEYEGQEQPLFQAMRITNTDGTPNFGQKLFTKFCSVCGAVDGAEIDDPVSRMIPMGKGGEEVECQVLEQFDNTPITIRLQMEYSMYDGKIQSTKHIRNFFRFEDKATAAEIVNDVKTKGEQFKQEQEYADKVSYKDGLTEEDVANWQKNLKSSKKEEFNKKPSTGFTRRTFGKKA